MLGRIARLAGDLQGSVNAWKRGADAGSHASSSRDPLVHLRLGRASRRLFQSAYDRAPAKLDLEVVVALAFGIAQHGFGRAGERRLGGRFAHQQLLGLSIAPRLVGDAAERDPRLGDAAVGDAKRGRDRDQRKRIGEAVAQLQIGAVPREVLRRELDRGDELTGSRLVSIWGVSPGRRCKSANAMTRSPAGPVT